MAHIKAIFWKSIDNHNRPTERRIGKLKKITQEKLRNEPTQLFQSDLQLRAYLCKIDSSEF